MRRRLSKPLVIVIAWAALVLASLYIVYRLVDPLPPRRFAIAAGIAGTMYDDFARQYARVLARLQAHSKSTCTDSGSICAWFKKTLVEWERQIEWTGRCKKICRGTVFRSTLTERPHARVYRYALAC